jgi:hypothetical protein
LPAQRLGIPAVPVLTVSPTGSCQIHQPIERIFEAAPAGIAMLQHPLNQPNGSPNPMNTTLWPS